MSAPSLWQTWQAYSWSERGLFFAALIAFPWLRLALALFGFTRVHTFLGSEPASRREQTFEVSETWKVSVTEKTLVSSDTLLEQLSRAKRIALLVEGAARRSPGRVNCLPRSLMLWWVLRRYSLASELRIGVRKPDETHLDAHAWVEYAGIPLNASQQIHEQYSAFSQPIVP